MVRGDRSHQWGIMPLLSLFGSGLPDLQFSGKDGGIENNRPQKEETATLSLNDGFVYSRSSQLLTLRGAAVRSLPPQ